MCRRTEAAAAALRRPGRSPQGSHICCHGAFVARGAGLLGEARPARAASIVL